MTEHQTPHAATRILFLCHGNICRSPMAEYILKALVRDADLDDRFAITSAAVSTEEIGNPIYPPARRVLNKYGVPFGDHRAHQVTERECRDNDFIVCMDDSNVRLLRRLHPAAPLDGKVRLLMSFAGEDRPVADPWYTDDFEAAYRDILAGCKALLEEVIG